MQRTFTRRARVILLGAAASFGMAIVGCSDTPTHRIAGPVAPAAAKPSFAASGSTTGLTVYSADGTKFMLDPAQRKLVIHDTALVLTDSQTLDALNGFLAIQDADLIATADWTYREVGGGTSCGNTVCDYSTTGGSGEFSSRQVSVGPTTSHFGTYQFRVDGSDLHSTAFDRKRAAVTSGATTMSMVGEPDCRSISEAIYTGTIGYRKARQNFLNFYAGLLHVSTYFGVGLDGVPFFKVPNAYSVAVLRVELDRTRISLNFLATMYTTYGCGNPSNWPGQTNTGGAFHYLCGYEVWQYSFDGGLTWQDYSIWVCYVNQI